MKITNTRIAARQHIFAITLLYTIIPLAIFALIQRIFKLNILGFWGLVGVLCVHPIVAAVITLLRIRSGDDTKVMLRWDQNRALKLAQRNEKLQKVIASAQETCYIIESIEPVPSELCVFKITFPLEILTQAPPLVVVNNVLVPIKIIDSKTVLCFVEKVVTATDETMHFSCGESSITLPNPYFMNIQPSAITWQNEGHAHEKVIYVDSSCLGVKDPRIHYRFDLLVNGAFYGTYFGKYHDQKDKLVIDIAGVNKKDCNNKKCIIRPVFDKTLKIELPKPQKLMVDTN